MAPIPTPEVLWRKPPVLALAALPGTALGRLGEPSTASSAAWAAAGAAVRMLHDAPLPPWPGRSLDEIASDLDGECEWLVANGVLPTDLVTRNRRIAEAALRPWTPVFTHGDLQITHVFVDGDEITGVIDWSEAAPGRCPVRPRHLDARTRGAPWRRRRRLRHRRRPRRDPRVVVVAKPAGGPLADRARLRPVLARLRVRRAEIPAVKLHEQRALQTYRHAMFARDSPKRGSRHSAFRRAARRQSDRGPRPGSDPDADEMNLLAASGALCWAAGMAASTGRGGREAGVTETDGLTDVGRLVVSAVQAGSAVEFRILKPGDGDGGHNR